MKYTFTAILLSLGLLLSAQTLQQLNVESKSAYENKEFAKLLTLSQMMNDLRPSHPGYTYNLACAYALNGENEKAIETLIKSLMMNNTLDFENDADLKSIKTSPSYNLLIEVKSSLGRTITSSKKVVSLSEKNLHPEGLVYLSKSKQWLSTSIRKGKIIAFDIKTGKCTDWFTDPSLLAVFSIKADKNEEYLYVSTAAMPELLTFSEENGGKGEVLKVRTATKKIVNRFPVAGNHVFGDLVVSDNGIVYISDSGKAIIYKIENEQMSEWLNLENEAFNLQGITFNKNRDKIYIADYLKGILEISISDPSKRHWLEFPAGTAAKGIDGLIWYNNSLIAVHNGVKPIRIIRYFLDESGKISGYTVIDHNRPEFDEPAMGIIEGNGLYFFANNPWKVYDNKYNLDESKFENPMLFKSTLD